MAKKKYKEERTQNFTHNLSLLLELFKERKGVIIGIDPARGRIGVGIYSPKKKKHTVQSFKPKGRGFTKLLEIEMWLHEILDGRKIRFACIEDYAYNTKHGREKAGELGGIIRRYLWIRGIPLFPIAIQTVKALIGAKNKNLIIKEVLKQYGFDTNNDDEADAFILVKIGELLYNTTHEFSKRVPDHEMAKCETYPHRYCSLNSAKAKMVKTIIIDKGEGAYAFGKEDEETRKKANASIGRKKKASKKTR